MCLDFVYNYICWSVQTLWCAWYFADVLCHILRICSKAWLCGLDVQQRSSHKVCGVCSVHLLPVPLSRAQVPREESSTSGNASLRRRWLCCVRPRGSSAAGGTAQHWARAEMLPWLWNQRAAKLLPSQGSSGVGMQPDPLCGSVGWWHLSLKMWWFWAAELAAPCSGSGSGVPWGSCMVSQLAQPLPQTSQAPEQNWQQPLRARFASTKTCWRWNLQRADECMCLNSRETSLHIEGTDKWERCPLAVWAAAALTCLSPQLRKRSVLPCCAFWVWHLHVHC